MTTPYPTRRTGLGRRVADIVGGTEPAQGLEAPGGLLAGPTVVPVELVPFPMLISDGAGRVLAVNQRWIRLTGLTPTDSRGSGWLAAVHPDERPAVRALVESVAGGAPIRRGEFALLPTGTMRSWWLASHERAGQRLVGIAVGEPVGREAPAATPASAAAATPAAAAAAAPAAQAAPAAHGASVVGAGIAPAAPPVPVPADPVLAELPGLFMSLRALLDSFERLAQRLPEPAAV